MMRAAGILLTFALVGACGVEEGRPPVARISVDPVAIPEHDDFRTPVTLDGTASDDPIDDPDGLDPLEFGWEILGDEFRFEPGSHADDPTPVILLRGSTPATVRLTVTDVDGRSTTAEHRIVLTLLR